MKLHYILIGLGAFAIGFVLQSTFRPSSLPPAPLNPQTEVVEQRFREISSIGQPGLEMFFEKTGRPGIVYIYRTDCAECDSQWTELKPLMETTPFLVVSFDDKRLSLARKLAAEEGKLTFMPHHVPPRRMLTVRTWLRDHDCGFSGTLPFVAVTDGKGRCAAVWEGNVTASTVESSVNALKNNNSSASVFPILP